MFHVYIIVRQAETKAPAAMSKDIAMKTLGLCQVQGQGANRGKAKTLNDYSEDDILSAFQTESQSLGTATLWINLSIDRYININFSRSRKICRDAVLP